jgi:penicillin-binding protein 2
VQRANVPITFLDEPAFVTPVTDDGRLTMAEPRKVFFPDLEQPLPLEGLVALVKRAVAIQSQGSASDPVPILDGIDRIRAFEVSEDSFRIPAVRVNQVPVREYIYGDLLSHVLGFMGPIPAFVAEDYKTAGYNNPNEKVGLNGLEFTYQEALRGKPGVRNSERDILGVDVRTVGPVVEPVPGLNLHLNIDRRLQAVMRDALQEKMTELDAPWGVTVALNPQNGAVLGMVSLPSYDNNIFAERIDEEYLALEADDRRPLINHAIGGLYPPGSTFKMVTAAAGLAEGCDHAGDGCRGRRSDFSAQPILPERYVAGAEVCELESQKRRRARPAYRGECVGALERHLLLLSRRRLPGGFQGAGTTPLEQVDRVVWLWRDDRDRSAGEVTSLVPTDQWKRQLFAEPWTTGDSYNMAIGQGYVLATPMQVLIEIMAVANGGTIYVPKVVHHMTDANGGVQQDFAPEIKRTLPYRSGRIGRDP